MLAGCEQSGQGAITLLGFFLLVGFAFDEAVSNVSFPQ